ncbi:uncharacterized protein EI90DRAFT_3073327 [Cantharellus anzutake]|uniref:uncharacterized protein n=1 Tax=Cantharellus anzutake TaxID=1750568 RepID=UPI0019088F19|nr:uncharacterized protein EI90DRAFT_3073327 [Cantharellus anzutake]KAF8325202.1 hypothetical protein EI90DRAFT_3073327 [Cantharellus anzutake]
MDGGPEMQRAIFIVGARSVSIFLVLITLQLFQGFFSLFMPNDFALATTIIGPTYYISYLLMIIRGPSCGNHANSHNRSLNSLETITTIVFASPEAVAESDVENSQTDAGSVLTQSGDDPLPTPTTTKNNTVGPEMHIMAIGPHTGVHPESLRG